MESFSIISIDTLKPWNVPEDELKITKHENLCTTLKFSVSPSVNQKIYVCQGGATRLELDAIVLPINQMSLSQTILAQEVHQAAGVSIRDHYKFAKAMKTGSVLLGSGYDLAARFIIHAKEPGINVKYQSATENALHRCYRNAMQTAAENNLKTIGFTSLYERTHSSLDEEMAHIAIGTLRCCLNKLTDKFEAIVFTVSIDELDLYLKLLPAYFPRSQQEGLASAYLTAPYTLGEWGERIEADREIRITDLPLSTNSTISKLEDESRSIDVDGDVENLSPDISSEIVSKHSFASMTDDHDRRRLSRIKSMSTDKARVTQERVYQRLLRLSRTHNLCDVEASKGLCLRGEDRNGSSIAVVVAKYIDPEYLSTDKGLLYFIRTLDPIVNQSYSIVYFHTMSQSHNHPSLSFMKRAYSLLDDRYKKNLKSLYIVHPTLTSRVITWFFTTFAASAVKGQVFSITNLPQLYKYIAPDQIDIPPFVSDYDLKVNLDVYQSHS